MMKGQSIMFMFTFQMARYYSISDNAGFLQLA